MSSPKKIGRWNRFEIAFNEGNWPKPSFSPSEKTQGLRKIVKETPDTETTTPEKPSLAGSSRPAETSFGGAPSSEKTSDAETTPPEKPSLVESSRPEETSFGGTPSSEETSEASAERLAFREVAALKTAFLRSASASLWTEARRRAERAEERAESGLEFERLENSELEEGRRAFPPRRPRTFRVEDSSDA